MDLAHFTSPWQRLTSQSRFPSSISKPELPECQSARQAVTSMKRSRNGLAWPPIAPSRNWNPARKVNAQDVHG